MSEELLKIAEGLSLIADGVRSLAEKEYPLTSQYKKEGTQKNEAQVKEQKKKAAANQTISIEEVRAVMAEKSQDGKTQQVKALIQKYGADKLSGVQPEHYENLLKDAKSL